MFSLHLALCFTMISVALGNSFNDLGGNFMSDIRLLDEDFDIFNKTLASKSTSTVRNYGAPRTPPTAAVPYTSKYAYPTSAPITGAREIPSFPPPSRNSYTPSLPPQFLSPFADKPTLRGSNSDNVIPNKRPIPPPPTLSKLPSEKDRIPIKPPDFAGTDTRKKSINTPSIQKLPENVLNYSEPSSSPTSTTHRINDTYEFVIPMVQNISSPSILRILDNGKKHDFLGSNKPRLEHEIKPKTNKDDTLKSLSSTTVKPTSVSVLNKDEEEEEEDPKELSPFIFPQNNIVDVSINQDNVVKEQQVTEGKSDFHPPVKSVQEPTEITTDRPEPRKRYILGIAWDIHVYLIATLFALLACMSIFNLFRIRSCKWLLPWSYFVTIHGLLMLIGIDRSVYLFYDAYNIGKSFSEPVSRLLLNIVFPFIIAVFSIMFIFLLKTIDIKVGYYYIKKTYIFLALILAYIIFSVFTDLYANLTSYSSVLILISQCLFIIFCISLGLTYIYLYRFMSHASVRKQNSVYSSPYADQLRPSLSHAIRVMLATSLLSLLMSAIQLIGMICIYEPFGKDQPHPWLWWAFQLSARVIEISICFLISWAGVQPSYGEDEKETHSHNSASGFALFPWGMNTPRDSDTGNSDDIYPTICNSNQAIHNYSLRTGKQVYEDIFPLNNIRPSSALPTHLLSHTTERRSIKRHPLDGDITRSTCGTLVSYTERRPQPSSSMLVDEKGLVRFRPFNECNPQPEEFFNSHLVHSGEEYST